MKNEVHFLKKTRYLIKIGNSRFVNRKYNGKDYVQVLLEDFQITVEEAWEHIKTLKPIMYSHDDKPNFYDSSDAFIFEKSINGVEAYIKIAIEECIDGEEEVVIISFHRK